MIQWVGSPDDPRLAPYRHVGEPEWLRQHGLFVAEGRLVVERLLAMSGESGALDKIDGYAIHSILLNRAAYAAMTERLASAETDVFVCDDPSLTGVTGFNFHRGCLALVERPASTSPRALVTATRLLAVEGVSNPDNLGGLFRTAAAFGVDGVLLSGATGDPFYRKAVRTSMAAVLGVPFARIADWPRGLEPFTAGGFTIVALTPKADAVSIAALAATARAHGRTIVLVGAEGPGLSADALARADMRVRIPIDPAVDSLNVVVAAGIALSYLWGGAF
jgi:tRNA G18 (ribose-2'-O)-methylase SpoU